MDLKNEYTTYWHDTHGMLSELNANLQHEDMLFVREFSKSISLKT